MKSLEIGRHVSKQDTGQQEDTGQEDTGQQEDVERYDSGQIKEKPEPSDDQNKEAENMRQSYIEERPTTALPGTGSTVTGTAVNEWLDDEGNPVHGEISEERQEVAEQDREVNERARKPADDDDSE